jgi:hypothetical protein
MEATRRVARTWRLVCQHELERRLVATTRATGTEPTRAPTNRARLPRACWAIPLSSLASEPHSAVVVMHEAWCKFQRAKRAALGSRGLCGGSAPHQSLVYYCGNVLYLNCISKPLALGAPLGIIGYYMATEKRHGKPLTCHRLSCEQRNAPSKGTVDVRIIACSGRR